MNVPFFQLPPNLASRAGMLRLSRSFVERLIVGATFIKVFTTKFELPRLVREHHNFRELFESNFSGSATWIECILDVRSLKASSHQAPDHRLPCPYARPSL